MGNTPISIPENPEGGRSELFELRRSPLRLHTPVTPPCGSRISHQYQRCSCLCEYRCLYSVDWRSNESSHLNRIAMRALGWVAFMSLCSPVANVAAAEKKHPNSIRVLEATYGGNCEGLPKAM